MAPAMRFVSPPTAAMCRTRSPCSPERSRSNASRPMLEVDGAGNSAGWGERVSDDEYGTQTG